MMNFLLKHTQLVIQEQSNNAICRQPSPVKRLLQIGKKPVQLVLGVWKQVKFIVEQPGGWQICVIAPDCVLRLVGPGVVKCKYGIHRQRMLTCPVSSLLLQHSIILRCTTSQHAEGGCLARADPAMVAPDLAWPKSWSSRRHAFLKGHANMQQQEGAANNDNVCRCIGAAPLSCSL